VSRIRDAISNFWFRPVPAARLGWLRVLTGGFQMYFLIQGQRSFRYVARSAHEHWVPVGLASFLPGPIPPQLYDGLFWATLALGVCFVLGFWYRFFGPLFAVLVIFVVSYRLSWGMIYRNHHLLGLHVLLLGMVPAAKAISLDAWLSKRPPGHWSRIGIWPGVPDGPHWRHAWPVKLMCVVTTLAYSLAGVAKITGQAGWDWASGNNLRNHVAHDALAKELMTRTGAAEWVHLAFLDERIMVGMAWVSLICELFAPFFLVHRRLAQLWVVTVICMHAGIVLMMDLVFAYQCYGFAFASFFAVEAWAVWVGRKAGLGSAMH
jgi:hypothetical protein